MIRKGIYALIILAMAVPACASSNRTAYQQQVRAAETGFQVYDAVANGAASKAASLVKASRVRKLVDSEKDTLRKVQGIAQMLGSYKELHNVYLGIVEHARKAQKMEAATAQEKKEAMVNAEIARIRVETMTQNMLRLAGQLGLSVQIQKGASP